MNGQNLPTAIAIATLLAALLTTLVQAEGPTPTPETKTTPTPTMPPVQMRPLHLKGPPAGHTSPATSPTQQVIPLAWTTYLDDGFEGTFPSDSWQVFDLNGDEEGVYIWAKRDCRALAGRHALWAVGGGADGVNLECGTNYPANVDSWAVAGPFDLSNTTAAALSFRVWLNTDDSSYVGVVASVDGENYAGFSLSGQVQAWIPYGLDLSNAYRLGDVTGQPQVWIGVVFRSGEGAGLSGGAYIDELSLAAFRTSTAPGQEDVVLQDNFEDGNAYGWLPVEGNWWVAGGSFTGKGEDTRAIAGNVNWTDYVYEGAFSLDPSDAREASLLFRVQSAHIQENQGRYYQVIHRANPIPFLQHHVELHRIADGSRSTLATSDDVDIVPGRRYRFRLELRGSQLNYYLGDRLVLHTGSLTEYNRGAIGVKAFESTASFDNIVVHSLTCVDPFEPDNSRAESQPIQPGSLPQRHQFCQAGDEDWVRFEARAGYAYTAHTWQLRPAADTVLSLCDETTCLVTDDDGGNEPRASQVVWQAPRAGTFYLKVRQREPSTAGVGTHYNLSLIETPPPTTPAVQFESILPTRNTIPSVVERGGMAHRYYDLSLEIGAFVLDANVTTEVEERAAVEIEARFDQPYTPPQQKAQVVFVLQGLSDIGKLALHSRPLLSQVIDELQTRTAYQDHLTRISDEEGVAWTPIHVSAGADLFVGPPGLAELTLIRLDAVEAGVTFIFLGRRTDYPHEGLWSVSMEQAVEIETALLTVSPLVKERVGRFVGDRTYKVKEELFFRQGTNTPERFELTLVGKGNPLTFTNIIMREVGYTFVVTGPSLQRALDAQIPNLLALLAAADQNHDDRYGLGSLAARRELSDFLNRVSFADYYVRVVTEGTITPVLELTLGPIIKLELGVELKRGRELIRERGQVTLDGLMPTESYPDDAYGQVSGKDIWGLLSNALAGAWQVVGDLFHSTTGIIRAGTSWLIQIAAASPDGSIQGGAVLSGMAGTQIQIYTWNVAAPEDVTEVEVQATSWVPRPSARSSRLALASGADFVVGGAYQFSPAETFLSPAASLVLTYTAEAAAGVDESQLRIYRREEPEYRWITVSDSVVNPTERQVLASVGRLGTFVIGYDAQPPVITIITPTHASTLNTYHPGVMASVADAESGVDPTSVSLVVDDSPVSVAYHPASSLMETVCPLRLSAGSYTLTVTARDSAGNAANSASQFTIAVGPPSVTSIDPAWGWSDSPTRVRIIGDGFQLGLSADCKPDMPPRVLVGGQELVDVAYVATGWLEALVSGSMPTGTYDVLVRNPDGQTATLPAAYTVRAVHTRVYLPVVRRDP